VFPPNECFDNYLPSGVQNATHCKADSPAFLSFPHFHLADDFFRDQFDPEYNPINPVADLHESRMVLEPNTGIPVEVAIRLQINIELQPNAGISLLKNLPSDLFLPCLWFDTHITVTPPVASKLQTLIDL